MKKKVVIATHVYAYGQAQALREYLRGKAEVLFIGHSMIGNLFTWAWGALDTFWRVLKTGKKFDLYVGSDSLKAFIGILLKKIGRMKKVVFYAPDLPRNRFKNRVLNYLYHQLDLFCVKQADFVWNNLARMVQEREMRGLEKKYRKKQVEVPAGTHLTKPVPFNKIDRYLVGFAGHLTEEKGLDLMIEAMPEISKKIPQVKLLIIGSGPVEEKLKNQVKKLKLRNVQFTGFIKDIRKVYQRLSKCAIAVAPYPQWTRVRWGNPSKIKVYFSAGLPVVITDIIEIAKEIDKEKAGMMIKFDREELTTAVLKLLQNPSLLKTYKKNVRRLAYKYSYDRIFDKALKACRW